MDLSYGARLRLQRERKCVALSDIVELTKIKLSLLEGLERDDVSQWPAGIYRRSYFRAYAQAIGLDPISAVREFLDRFPDPLDEFAGAAEPGAAGTESSSRWPTTRLRYLIDSAVGALPARRAQPAEAPPPTAEASRPSSVLFEHPRNVEERPAREVIPAPTVDFLVVARLCTRFASVLEAREIAPILDDASAALDACGVILWIWDPRGRTLGAALAHGYSNEVLRQLPRVPADADNAIASAFRTGETGVVQGNGVGTGAVVVPLRTPSGCTAVLALEFRSGREQDEQLRAAVTILAAQLATLVGAPAFAHAVSA
jgi:hypothetical protein